MDAQELSAPYSNVHVESQSQSLLSGLGAKGRWVVGREGVVEANLGEGRQRLPAGRSRLGMCIIKVLGHEGR